MINDLTRGRPIKVLLAFSVPMLIGNVVQQLYNMVDLIVVGRFVGVNALAAVGATGSTMFFVFSLVAGLTNGASVVVSQYYGYGDMDKMRRTVATAVVTLGVAGLVLTVFGTAIVRPVMVLMNTPPEILDGAISYLRVIFLGVLATVAYNTSASIIRAVGDSITPLVFLIIAALLNIVLDILFVVPLGMGVAGAAWATVLAQALSAAGCILYAWKKIPVLRLKKSDFAFDKRILMQTIKMGVPGGIQNSVIAMSSMVVQSVVNSFGATIVAAYAGATKLDQLAMQPMMSLAMASATYTAQNIGAGKIQRVKRGFWSAIAMAAVFCLAMTGVLYLFGGNLMTLFVESSEVAVLEAGVGYLRVVSLFYVVLGVLVILENMLRGAGDVYAPLTSNCVERVVRLVLAYSLSGMIGYEGILWSAPLAWFAGLAICTVRYLSGKWQDKALVFNGENDEILDTINTDNEYGQGVEP